MLAIRLARVGAKKKPAYRVVVTEKSRPRNSSSLEIVGHYNPTKDPILLSLKRERIDYWVGQGAQPSKTVARLMRYEPPEPVEEASAKAEPAAKAEAPTKVEPAPEAAEPTAEAQSEPVADAQAEPAAQEPAAEVAEPAAEAAAEESGTAEAESAAESDVAEASEAESGVVAC